MNHKALWHEASHATASYLVGRGEDVDLIVVDGAARCSNLRTVGDVTRTPEAAEAAIVVLLAGSESMRALGLDPTGGDADERLAAEIAVAASDTLEAAHALYDRAQARTRELVRRPKYQTLLLDLVDLFDRHRAPAMTGRAAMNHLRASAVRFNVTQRESVGARVGATVPGMVIR